MMKEIDHKEVRKLICEKYGSQLIDSPDDLKVGISKNVKDGVQPINGMRHPLEKGTTGWYIWAGEELPVDPDFFVPLHVKHLHEWSPMVLKYLGLAPGWRFIVAENYEDVWYDASLLDI